MIGVRLPVRPRAYLRRRGIRRTIPDKADHALPSDVLGGEAWAQDP